jgi:hypothetical protein
MISMLSIQRNDVVYIANAFYDRAIGYLGVMRTATIDIATEVLPGEAVERRESSIIVLSTAELAECTCPDSCERDHDRD